MPRFEGTVTLVSDPLTTTIGKLLIDETPAGIPLPRGTARIRTTMPLGASRVVPVTGGAFSVTVPDLPPPFRYRLLIEQTNGASAVPIYRSPDLPSASASNLKIFVRVLDAADVQLLAAFKALDADSPDPDPTVVTSAEIDKAARDAADEDPNDSLVDAKGRVEEGFVKIDFTYAPFLRTPGVRFRGTLTLEPSPSRSFHIERLVDMDFVRIDLRGIAAAVEDTQFIRSRGEAAARKINTDLADKFRDKIEKLGKNLGATVTIVSATEPGSEIRLATAMGFLR